VTQTAKATLSYFIQYQLYTFMHVISQLSQSENVINTIIMTYFHNPSNPHNCWTNSSQTATSAETHHTVQFSHTGIFMMLGVDPQRLSPTAIHLFTLFFTHRHSIVERGGCFQRRVCYASGKISTCCLTVFDSVPWIKLTSWQLLSTHKHILSYCPHSNWTFYVKSPHQRIYLSVTCLRATLFKIFKKKTMDNNYW